MRENRLKLLSLVFVAVVTAGGCSRAVKIVVPDGFTGEAILIYDPVAGTVPGSEGLYCVYRIPADGKLRIKSQDVFSRLHYTTVEHADGRKAKVAQEFSRVRMVGLKSSTDDPGTEEVWLIESKPAR